MMHLQPFRYLLSLFLYCWYFHNENLIGVSHSNADETRELCQYPEGHGYAQMWTYAAKFGTEGDERVIKLLTRRRTFPMQKSMSKFGACSYFSAVYTNFNQTGMTCHLNCALFLYLHHHHCQSQTIIFIRLLCLSPPGLPRKTKMASLQKLLPLLVRSHYRPKRHPP